MRKVIALAILNLLYLMTVRGELDQNSTDFLQESPPYKNDDKLQDDIVTKRRLGHTASASSSSSSMKATSSAKLVSTHTKRNPNGAVWIQGPFEQIKPGFPSLTNKEGEIFAKTAGKQTNQWCGWKFPKSPNGKWQYHFRMSAWIAFQDSVPNPSNQFGFKMTGEVKNDWVRGMKPNEYKWVSVVGKIVKDGDKNHVIYIFDSIEESQVIYLSGMKLEIFDDVPQPLENKYYQSKAIGAIETQAIKSSRSGYYASKQSVAKANYISPKQSSQIKSLVSDQATVLDFKNKAGVKVDIFWHDYTGQLKFYKRLNPDQTWTINSFITHPWSATDTNGQKLYINGQSTFVASSQAHSLDIGTQSYAQNGTASVAARASTYTPPAEDDNVAGIAAYAVCQIIWCMGYCFCCKKCCEKEDIEGAQPKIVPEDTTVTMVDEVQPEMPPMQAPPPQQQQPMMMQQPMPPPMMMGGMQQQQFVTTTTTTTMASNQMFTMGGPPIPQPMYGGAPQPYATQQPMPGQPQMYPPQQQYAPGQMQPGMAPPPQ